MKKYKPLPDSLTIRSSPIHKQGVFATEFLPEGTKLGISHVQWGEHIFRTPLGGFLNHSDTPNCAKYKIRVDHFEDPKAAYNYHKWNVTVIEDITPGEELTLEYTFYKV